MENVWVETLKMWTSNWKNQVKSFNMMQEQGERILDLFLDQAQSIQEETKKSIKESMSKAHEAQDACYKIVDENLKRIEQMLT